ncbi:hypothetical protein B0J11DRAFT_504796 [Dendryphion nanum]|uniref:Uncharacterized protein n=1 Tax=Dendryphion nanum TaxID=256645 RepID=A0A9P9DZW3_9PLEO|nr:hypothetical protein B0J11DRAFT_504796 [Dendryphion nanum]
MIFNTLFVTSAILTTGLANVFIITDRPVPTVFPSVSNAASASESWESLIYANLGVSIVSKGIDFITAVESAHSAAASVLATATFSFEPQWTNTDDLLFLTATPTWYSQIPEDARKVLIEFDRFGASAMEEAYKEVYGSFLSTTAPQTSSTSTPQASSTSAQPSSTASATQASITGAPSSNNSTTLKTSGTAPQPSAATTTAAPGRSGAGELKATGLSVAFVVGVVAALVLL